MSGAGGARVAMRAGFWCHEVELNVNSHRFDNWSFEIIQ